MMIKKSTASQLHFVRRLKGFRETSTEKPYKRGLNRSVKIPVKLLAISQVRILDFRYTVFFYTKNVEAEI